VTPSREKTSAKSDRSALTTLVLLQDLDLMIRDATDPEQAEEVSRMGFKVEGLEGLKSAREDLAASLEPRVMRQYQVAASRYAGRAVVPVKDRVCLGCWAMQPTGFEAHADRIATCQSCGRILYPV
jgi:predicted  nucleic acid-binding Zn-ribbon protein